MRVSIPSFLGLSCLSLLASTGLALGLPASQSNTDVIVDIHQLFANYSIILDDKNYSDLSYIITENAVFVLPTITYSTRATAESRYSAEFLNKTTLHTVQNIFVSNITPTTADVSGDGVTTYFGWGNLTSQSEVEYARINYVVIKDDGTWKINHTTIQAGVSSCMKLSGAMMLIEPLVARLWKLGHLSLKTLHRRGGPAISGDGQGFLRRNRFTLSRQSRQILNFPVVTAVHISHEYQKLSLTSFARINRHRFSAVSAGHP